MEEFKIEKYEEFRAPDKPASYRRKRFVETANQLKVGEAFWVEKLSSNDRTLLWVITVITNAHFKTRSLGKGKGVNVIRVP